MGLHRMELTPARRAESLATMDAELTLAEAAPILGMSECMVEHRLRLGDLASLRLNDVRALRDAEIPVQEALAQIGEHTDEMSPLAVRVTDLGEEGASGIERAEIAAAGRRVERVLYPVQDGPGAGDQIELNVLVMRGSRRSTVSVADRARPGRALLYKPLEHADAAEVAADAVRKAVRGRWRTEIA